MPIYIRKYFVGNIISVDAGSKIIILKYKIKEIKRIKKLKIVKDNERKLERIEKLKNKLPKEMTKRKKGYERKILN